MPAGSICSLSITTSIRALQLVDDTVWLSCAVHVRPSVEQNTFSINMFIYKYCCFHICFSQQFSHVIPCAYHVFRWEFICFYMVVHHMTNYVVPTVLMCGNSELTMVVGLYFRYWNSDLFVGGLCYHFRNVSNNVGQVWLSWYSFLCQQTFHIM